VRSRGSGSQRCRAAALPESAASLAATTIALISHRHTLTVFLAKGIGRSAPVAAREGSSPAVADYAGSVRTRRGPHVRSDPDVDAELRAGSFSRRGRLENPRYVGVDQTVPVHRRSSAATRHIEVAMTVISPTDGVDPRAALASSIHASPGVYALLAGSGVSTAAGIPTGYQVVEILAARVATLDGVVLEQRDQTAIQWFAATYGHEPRYDELLERLAPTDHDRRALLREFFEQPSGASEPIQPTAAHRIVARLCAQERIRVVLTTNFDHLLEHALDDAGARTQVLVNQDDRDGMEPLQHASTTLIKLHGDYRSTMLNTEEELSSYPEDLQALVDEVLDRYGLIVVGWSGEYDRALANRIAAAHSRRYPTYWLRRHGRLAEPAVRLVDARRATPIEIDSADEFFTDLNLKLERLDNVAARQRQPTALWVYHHAPQTSAPPAGWAALPLLQLRAVAVVSPVRLDDCGPIGPGDREAVVLALENALVTQELWVVENDRPLVSALQPTPGDVLHRAPPVSSWIPTPGAHQSLASGSYRLGGDASVGVSSLLEFWLPRPQAGSVLITFDIALSLRGGLAVNDAIRLWQSALMLLTGPIRDALAGIVPHDGDVAHVEIHAAAPESSGQGHTRSEGLFEQLRLGIFGQPTDSLPRSVGQAMRVEGALGEHDAGEIVLDALERIALNCGFLDPRAAMKTLRAEVRDRERLQASPPPA
jgi:hypothetical protein